MGFSIYFIFTNTNDFRNVSERGEIVFEKSLNCIKFYNTFSFECCHFFVNKRTMFLNVVQFLTLSIKCKSNKCEVKKEKASKVD